MHDSKISKGWSQFFAKRRETVFHSPIIAHKEGFAGALNPRIGEEIDNFDDKANHR